jgi:hypothetical protein
MALSGSTREVAGVGQIGDPMANEINIHGNNGAMYNCCPGSGDILAVVDHETVTNFRPC